MLVEVVIGLLLLTLLWLYLTDGDDPLDKLPGPPKLPIIGNTHHMMQIPNDKVLEKLMGFTKAYGDRYSIKIMKYRVLHIVRPSDIEVVLSYSKNIKKSLAYYFLNDWLGNGLLLSTGSHWHKRRKILTPAFHFNILKNFLTIMDEKIRELIDLLKEKKGAEVNIVPIISDFTLFTICETAMGTKLDNDQSTATIEYKNAIVNIGLLLIRRVNKVWMWTEFVFKNTSTGKQFYKNLETLHSFSDSVIRDRKAQFKPKAIEEVSADTDLGTKKRMAMLDLLLEAEAKGEIDMEGIRDEVNTFMFEGHDTVAMAITFGLMLLAEHEDIQERIYWELQGILNYTDRSPTMPDLADMKYMEAVIKEILRLYPSLPLIGREIDEDFMLDDLLVKKGTTVNMHIYELHHREDLFPDAEAFKPERFLPGSELKHNFSFVPFSAGPRNCIDSLVKAREKAKQAEIDSEINSDDGAVQRPRRKKNNYDSDDSSEDNIGDNLSFICPTPPATQIEGNPIAPTLSDKEQEALPKIQPTPNTSIIGSEASMPDISSLDLTITPLINDVVPNSHALGQRFAMQELKTTFCQIIRNFKLEPKVKGARPRIVANLVMRPIDPVYIKFIPRK